MMAVFRSLAFAERTNPDVIRLTANTCKSALPVAIPCNDALFVLVLRFMNFSSDENQNRNRMAPALSISLKRALGELLPNSPCSALLAFQEEAVKCIARIKEASDDRPSRVDVTGEGALAWACARARGVKRGEAALLIPYEAVIHITRVNVISRNRPRYTDALGDRALAGACTRNWDIERGDGAVSGAHEAVSYATPVNERASDGSRRVDA
jgi:hypothetical protein